MNTPFFICANCSRPTVRGRPRDLRQVQRDEVRAAVDVVGRKERAGRRRFPSCPSAGSAPMTTMPSADALRASARPMRPTPRMPSVFPRAPSPWRRSSCPTPPTSSTASARGICRASENISASASSATDVDDADGVFITRTPSASAAATSMLSTPTPPRTITFRLLAAATCCALIFVAERTTTAS